MDKIGKYEVIGSLGQGGMGIVYKALDPDIKREVAIKVIRFDLISEESKGEEVKRRFIKEAQAVGKLLHPNIITIYDVGKEKDLTYIVMQYVDGKSLQRMIDSGKKFSLSEITQLMNQVCSALEYAHQSGIIHRDIKPANILIDKSGTPYIVDFGVARFMASTLTQSGTVIGTPSYMAPEQIMGKSVDKRADIFSLGVILYELISGRSPFEADSITTVIYKIINEEPAPLNRVKTALPAEFEHIIYKALAKDPNARYQSCEELTKDLRDLVPSSVKETTPYPVKRELGALQTRRKKRFGLIFGISVAFVLIVGGGAFYFYQKSNKIPLSSGEKSELTFDDSQLSPLTRSAPPDPFEDRLSRAKENLDKGEFTETVRLTEDVLAEDSENVTAQEYLDKAKDKMNEALILQKLEEGIDSYKQGDHLQCIRIMEEVLKLDKNNSQAQNYIYLADTAISKKKLMQLLERQRKAEEQKDLLALLSDIDSAELTNQRKSDAIILFNYYEEIKSLVSNISVKFKDRHHAEITFSHILTATYKKTGGRKVLFEGTKTWITEKQGSAWKIIDIQ